MNRNTEDPHDWMERNIGTNAGLNALWCVSAWFLCGEGDSGVYVLDLEESGPSGWGIVSRICDDEADIDETEDLFIGTFQQVQHIVESILRGKQEILQDIANGTVPANVDCFGDLDDHTDCAMYGGRGDDGWFAALGQSCVDAGVGSDARPEVACDPEQCKGGIHDSVYGWGIHADAAKAREPTLSTWLHARA